MEPPAINGWYELFSRGSHDWLRHSEKIRDAVREHLPQIVAGADIIPLRTAFRTCSVNRLTTLARRTAVISSTEL